MQHTQPTWHTGKVLQYTTHMKGQAKGGSDTHIYIHTVMAALPCAAWRDAGDEYCVVLQQLTSGPVFDGVCRLHQLP
jgi:hypothetical protein